MCYPPKTMTRYTQQHGQNYEKRVDITTYNCNSSKKNPFNVKYFNEFKEKSGIFKTFK